MPRTHGDTKAEIRGAALDLFRRQGYEKTSLREIAERLNITKAALYYHFRSKEDLLRALVDPLERDMEDFLGGLDATAPNAPDEVLGVYFDLCVRHGVLMTALINDLASLTRIGLVDEVAGWRRRLEAVLVGENAGMPARMGVVMALGGIRDVAVLIPSAEAPEHRRRAVAIATAALLEGTGGRTPGMD
ncbi:helix-turn-helix domain containing protein [Nocardiopsis sp. N85]|uniref:TetR/AcrR family transcriptional regulator n=1 Tax=Nocardiopsis sp. N85 TaxID=3029400 RepID=UPI00237F25BF|nr:TetR/AcrR family transcriptional regulator [Nocardiopsis sp. N85]MDE3721770.1 helix-turn-helix domain containing protein [Nocardiopsis sp. N85]